MKNNYKIAIREVSPIVLAYVFLGTACGVFLEENGLSAAYIFMIAVLLYSGSMTFILAPLLLAGASPVIVGLMTLFVNGRHIFYGVARLDAYSKHSSLEHMYLALTLTDEVYSVEVNPSYGKGSSNIKELNLLVHFISHSIWITGNMIGAFAGDIIPFDLTGIEFSATVFFFIVVLEQYLSFPTKIPLIIGLGTSVSILVGLGPDNFILPTMIVSVVLLIIFKDKITGKMEENYGR